MVLAALCYSLTTVRIGYFAARLQPLQLALAKSAGLSALAAGMHSLVYSWMDAVACAASVHHMHLDTMSCCHPLMWWPSDTLMPVA